MQFHSGHQLNSARHTTEESLVIPRITLFDSIAEITDRHALLTVPAAPPVRILAHRHIGIWGDGRGSKKTSVLKFPAI
jgi:hypothetical protein